MFNFLYKLKKYKSINFTFLSSLIGLPYIFALYFHEYFGIRDMWSYHISFHLVNYEDFGFVKRGIVGSIIKELYFLTNLNLKLIILSFYILCFIFFSFLYWKLCFKSKSPLIIKFALLISPAIFQHLGFISPRTSELIWLIAFAIWCLIISNYQTINNYICLFSGLIISFAALTYEGSIFFISPFIFTYIIFNLPKGNIYKKIININFLFLPALFTMYLLFKHGSYESESKAVIDILSNYVPNIDDRVSSVLVDDLIQKNFARQLNNINWFSNNIFLMLYFFSLVCINFLEVYKSRNGLLKSILLLTSFSGITLCSVALDYPRYIALSILINTMALFIIKKNENWYTNRIWYFVSIFAFLGPINCCGMVNAFPLWSFILNP